MKKILVLILALVTMLSLTACGGEKIEITTDNWQDYLEIKEAPTVERMVDGFGEVTDELVFNYTMLCLKDEYAGKTVSDDTDLTLKYSAKEVHYKYTLEGGKVVKGEKTTGDPINKEETIGYNYYSAFSGETDDKLVKEYGKIVLFPSGGNREIMGILEDIEIKRIEGTLVLE